MMDYKFLQPKVFSYYSTKAIKPISAITIILLLVALWQAIMVSPADYQQGETVRIMYVHVPSAWLSLMIYTFIALCSFINMVWRIKLAYILAAASAPIGASFAAITLITGSLWGKPMWGTWWVWDARLTSMLILFLFYLSYIAIVNAGNNIMRAEKPAAVIALLGFINVPIVKFSVDMWNSLHQPASVIRLDGPSIDGAMLKPLFLMFVSLLLVGIITLIFRANTLLLKTKLTR